MITLYFHRDDYIDNPRDTEGSNKVVRLWYDERVRYAEEDIPDNQCMGLVAERLIIRHLLGLEKLDMAYMPKASLAKPFGANTPMLADFLKPETVIAMALVPLSPEGLQGRPILARLYCVAGLPNRYEVPLEGMNEEALQGFSWFLAGVPQKLLAKGVTGRSWLLAANLLARIVGRRDIKTARNLAKHYIVTGDVSDGVIHRVEMLRKPELVKQFDSFKWIIPKENDMDIPKRRIEKPDTLEEAYRLIETMQNTMTRDLCTIVDHEIDTRDEKWHQRVDRIRDLLAKGADPNADVNGACAWSLYREKLCRLLDSEKSDEWSREQALLMDRTFSFYGAIPQFFFMLAHFGEEDMLKTLSQSHVFDIDALDCNCETALDFAEEVNDVRAKELLIAYGAKKRGRFLVNSQRFLTALVSLMTDQYWGKQKAEEFLIEALDNGLSPNDKISLGVEGLTKCGMITQEVPIPKGKEPMDEFDWLRENYKQNEFANTRYESTVLLEALYAGSKPIVEKCLAAGISPDVEIKAKYGSIFREEIRDGEVVEKHDEELNVPDTSRKRMSIDKFIRSADARLEFPDRGLAWMVEKYFDGLKSREKAESAK